VDLVGGTATRRTSPVGPRPSRVHPLPRTGPAPHAAPARRPAPAAGTGSPGTRTGAGDVIREVENGHVVWRIACGDMIGRDRCVTVFVDGDQVVVSGPPGETARMTPSQVGQLAAVLHEAARLAER